MKLLEISLRQNHDGAGWLVLLRQSDDERGLPTRKEGRLRAINREQLLASPTPRAYGQQLGSLLLADPVVASALSKTWGDARREKVRVLLNVEAPDLWDLRWERLCFRFDDAADAPWEFLALQKNLPFSFSVPSPVDGEFPPIGARDLRALVVVANPRPSEDLAGPSFDPAQVVIPLCDTLKTFTLLHMVCHGRLSLDEKETVLYLTDGRGGLQRAAGRDLIEALRPCRGPGGMPHFGFLMVCDSARIDRRPPRPGEVEEVAGGLAHSLVRDLGMPAVVGMTDQVSIPTGQRITERFYERLLADGRLDEALLEARLCLRPAPEPVDITVPSLFSRLEGRPLFSDSLERELTDAEIGDGLARAEDLLPAWAPSFQSRFREQATRVRALLRVDRKLVLVHRLAEWEAAREEVNRLCGQVFETSFRAVALNQPLPEFRGERCPFPGLEPFSAGDDKFFFEREDLAAQLLTALRRNRLQLLVGASGSGKSSLARAGLVPLFHKDEPGGPVLELQPGSVELTRPSEQVLAAGHPGLLVVDPFEEVFTQCGDTARGEVLHEITRLVEAGWLALLVVARDFEQECRAVPVLRQALDASLEVRVSPLDAAHLRRAMVKQADQVGLVFEPNLGENIMQDLEGQPGAMPLLQHTLRQLWHGRRGRWLVGEEYQRIGRVQGAIATTAEQVLTDLSPAEQVEVRGLFLRLVSLEPDAPGGHPPRDTRRRALLQELIPAGGEAAPTERLVERLRRERLVVRHDNIVELAHQELVRVWDWLRRTLADPENRRKLLIWQAVDAAARAWRRGEDASLLVHRGAQLRVADGLRTGLVLEEGGRVFRVLLNDLEVEYLDACDAAELQLERARSELHRRWLKRVAGLVALLVVTTVAAILLWRVAAKAERQRQEERDQAEVALAVNLARALARPGRRLTKAELEGLDDLARSSDRVRGLFLDELLREPQTASALLERAPLVLPVALRDNPALSRKLELLVVARLQDKSASSGWKLDCVRLAVALGDPNPELARAAAPVLLGALRRADAGRTHVIGQTVAAQGLAAPGTALTILPLSTVSLGVAACDGPPLDSAPVGDRTELARQLVVMAAPLSGEEAAGYARIAFGYLAQEATTMAGLINMGDACLERAWDSALARLDREAAATAAAAILDVLESVKAGHEAPAALEPAGMAPRAGGNGLPRAPRIIPMGPPASDRRVSALLGCLLGRLTPEDAAGVAGKAAKSVLTFTDHPSAPFVRADESGLEALMPYLDGRGALAVTRRLLDAHERADGLAREAASRLLKRQLPDPAWGLAEAYWGVWFPGPLLQSLSDPAAQAVVGWLSDELQKSPAPSRRQSCCEALFALSEKVRDEDLVAGALASALREAKDPRVAWLIGLALWRTSAGNRSPSAPLVVETLLLQMRTSPDWQRAAWAAGLPGALKHLPPQEAYRRAREAATLLTTRTEGQAGLRTIRPIAQVMTVQGLIPPAIPASAVPAAVIGLGVAASPATAPETTYPLPEGRALGWVGKYLEPAAAKRFALMIARSLRDGWDVGGAQQGGWNVTQQAWAGERAERAAGLVVLVGRLGPPDALEVARELAEASLKKRDALELHDLTAALGGTLRRLNADQARRLAVQVACHLRTRVVQARDQQELALLCAALACLTGYLGGEEADALGSTLVKAIPGAHLSALPNLIATLSAVQTLANRKDAARLAAPASAALLQRLTRADALANARLVGPIIASAEAWMDPVTGSQLAEALMEQLGRGRGPGPDGERDANLEDLATALNTSTHKGK